MAVNTNPLAKGLKASSSMLSGFQATVTKTGGALQSLFAGAAAYGATKAIGGMVKKASDLTEATSNLKQVFGASAQDVIDDSNRMAIAFGVSRTEFISSASAMGDMLINMGYTTDQAAKLSVAMTKLAGDIASAKNLRFDEALTKLQSGLAGEAEPLRRLGVDLTETAVKAQAAKMGIKAMGGELNASQKTQARLAIIMEKTKTSQGDLARTSGEVANAMRGVSGRVEYLTETIGASLEPVAKSVLGEMNTALQAMSLYWEDNKSSVVAWGQTTVGAVGESAKSMGWLQKSIGFVADAWDVMRLAFFRVQAAVTSGLATIVDSLVKVYDVLKFIAPEVALIGDKKFFKTWSEDLHRLADQQLEDFQKKLLQPWPSEGINAYFDEAKKKIEAMRKEAAKAGVDVSKITPKNAEAAKTEAPKFASAMVAGGKEAANAILRSRYGSSIGAKGAQEQTAANTKQMVDILKKIAGQKTATTAAEGLSALGINI